MTRPKLPHPDTAAFGLLASQVPALDYTGRVGVPIDPSPTIAQQVEVYRLARGWGQIELARRAGVAQPRINEVEEGANVTMARLHQIADALGVALVVLPVARAPEPKRRIAPGEKK